MAFLTREEFLALPDLAIEAIPGPNGQGEIGIRLLTGAEREWLVEYVATERERVGVDGRIKNFDAVVCTLGLCDEQGGRLFGVEEIEALAGKSAMFLEEARVRILTKSKLNQGDVAADEKKEPGAQSVASGSSLPVPLDAP